MTDSSASSDLQSFIDLSALLTGFAADVLAPALSPVQLAPVYLATAAEHTGAAFTQLMTQYDQLVASGASSEQIADQLLGLDGQSQQPEIIETAQAINKMWYLGSWYQPFDYQSYQAGDQFVVSDQAYIGGLAWQVMQSHAMGNSNFTFGYWAEDPPALDAFTGQTSEGDSE